jgi:predicted nucleotidyltransferase
MTVAPGVVVPQPEIAEICRRCDVKELAVFGSAARGEMRPDSDIDLLADFLPEARVSLQRHAAAERELTALLGRKVDLVSKRAVKDAVRDEVLPQARIIYAA